MKGGSGVTLKSTPYAPHRVKIGIKDYQPQQVPTGPPKDSWLLNDVGQVYGPLTWNQLMTMAEGARITPYGQLRNVDWEHWVPVWQYMRIKTPAELEAEALLPSRYDGIFFLGVFLFIAGIIGIIGNPFIGIPLLFVSPVIEYGAVYLESKNKAKAAMRTMGNAIAVFWIILQILISFFFMFVLF